MSLNFGLLNPSIESQNIIFLETVGRAGKLDQDLGVVASGGIAEWDRDSFPAALVAAKAIGRMVFKKSPQELLLPQSVNKPLLQAHLVSKTASCSSLAELTALVESVYSSALAEGHFFGGPYGDYITALAKRQGAENLEVTVTGLFQKAFPLIRAASDLVLTVEGQDRMGNHKIYVITGVRALDPGKGKGALFGGFRNVDKLVCEGPLFAALREGKEEAGVNVSIDNIASYKEHYDVKSLAARATVGGKSYPSQVDYLRTIPTSNLTLAEGGEKLSDGSKRVHFTSGYLCRIDMGKELVSFNPLTFQAGDDISKIKVVEATELLGVSAEMLDDAFETFAPKLSFGIVHHNDIFQDAIKHIRSHGRIVQEEKTLSCWEKFKKAFCCCRR